MLWEHIIFNFKRVEIRKMSEVFERNCVVKLVIFSVVFIDFEIFCYKFWNIKNSDDVHWNVVHLK